MPGKISLFVRYQVACSKQRHTFLRAGRTHWERDKPASGVLGRQPNGQPLASHTKAAEPAEKKWSAFTELHDLPGHTRAAGQASRRVEAATLPAIPYQPAVYACWQQVIDFKVPNMHDQAS